MELDEGKNEGRVNDDTLTGVTRLNTVRKDHLVSHQTLALAVHSLRLVQC